MLPQRAGVRSRTLRRVDAALGDGDVDAEDAALLESLLPPPAVDDFAACCALLAAAKDKVLALHRWYCTAGLAGTTGAAERGYMGMVQFRRFAEDCRMLAPPLAAGEELGHEELGHSGPGRLDGGVVDRVFRRAQQQRGAAGRADVAAMALQTDRALSASTAHRSHPLEHGLGMLQFGAALLRLAAAKYPAVPELAERLRWVSVASSSQKQRCRIS